MRRAPSQLGQAERRIAPFEHGRAFEGCRSCMGCSWIGQPAIGAGSGQFGERFVIVVAERARELALSCSGP